MEVSERGIDLVKGFESFSPKSYRDVAGVWTIGYGTTRIDGDPVQPNMTCTQEEADEWLRNDINEHFREASEFISPDVTLNQNQVDALASFVYNVGVGNFKESTLLKLINSGDMEGAADQFIRWNRAGGRVYPGLTRRREAEAELFSEPEE
jgi:lysozyme